MLIGLHIENFALIDTLDLTLESGLNVLTGETGAGKSIILDAIDAVLGGRVNRRAVRTGTDRAVIEATFAVDSQRVLADLAETVPSAPDRVVCTVELTISNNSLRNRSRINGVLVKKQQMDQVRDRLVEITAQGQTMQLGKPQLQREWLDAFGGEALIQQRSRVVTAYNQAQQAKQRLERRQRAEADRLQQLDLFAFQAKELAAASLQEPDELDQLEIEFQRLSHSVELQQQSYEVYQAIYQNDQGGEACADLLGKAEAILADMQQFDPEIQPILDMISTALTQVEEAGRAINTYGDGIETDPERLQDVEQRITQLKLICRKYGPTLADAIAHYESLQAQLGDLADADQSVEALTAAYAQAQAKLEATCAQLTTLRQATAQRLETELVQELKPLAMDQVQFTVEITPTPPHSTGADRIMFLFSPNPGEPPQPLDQVASGGEMSRFLLALKACFSQVDGVGTMVFDEIDVGVSGHVAQAIATKLYQLSRQHQVLCVTHQPLVAAMADIHFGVSKQVIETPSTEADVAPATMTKTAADDLRTVVRIAALSPQDRRQELAQLAGGQTAHEAMSFADALLTQAAALRHPPESIAAPTSAPSSGTAVNSSTKRAKTAKSAAKSAPKSAAKTRKSTRSRSSPS